MSAQTSYSINQRVALAGMIFALHTRDVDSRVVETVAGIDFGVAVSRGTDKEKQIVVGGTDFLGVTVRALDAEGTQGTGAIKYKEKDTAAVLRSGYIWVLCNGGATAGQAVKFVNATGLFAAGAAGAGETNLTGAKWETTTADGEVGLIRLETSANTAGA